MKAIIPFLFLCVVSTCWSISIFAQIPGSVAYSPFYSGSVTSNNSGIQWVLTSSNGAGVFIADIGQLHIGTVRAVGGDLDGQQVNDVVLELADDGRFDLKSYDEYSVTPEQECTEEEIFNAIPALTLKLTLEEAEQLIGCHANFSAGPTSLEAGKNVSANWAGVDGIPNLASGFATDTWIGSDTFGPVVPFGYIGSTQARPFPWISLNFLEGELVSYSYSEGVETEYCGPGQWLTHLQLLGTSTTYSDLNGLLGCDGILTSTTVSVNGTERTYSWTGAEPDPYGTVSPRNSWESAVVTFQNGEFQFLNYTGYTINEGISNCGVSDLSHAYELMREGYEEFLTVNLVPCQPDTVYTTIVSGVTTSRYTWRTKNPASLFESPNRIITAIIVDGIAEQVDFRRL